MSCGHLSAVMQGHVDKSWIQGGADLDQKGPETRALMQGKTVQLVSPAVQSLRRKS